MDRNKEKMTLRSCLPVVRSPALLFEQGMKRSMGRVHAGPSGGLVLNLGAGDFRLPPSSNHYNLQLPEWMAPMLTQFEDEQADVIHAYHFLEHLDKMDIKHMLVECSRVLKPEGVMNICVPYAKSDIAFQDIDHMTFFTEESWETLLDNPYYDTFHGASNRPKFEIGANFIAGINGRNLGVFTQLVKES